MTTLAQPEAVGAKILRPQDLPNPGGLERLVALDTEGNGLFPDDGARCSIVSLAWIRAETVAEVGCWVGAGPDGSNAIPHPVGTDRDCGFCRGIVEAVAFPFAQGKWGKPEDDGVVSLFELDDVNLGRGDWADLREWVMDPRIRLTMQNRIHDQRIVRAGTMPRPGLGCRGFEGWELEGKVDWDTMVTSKELWPTEPTGLKPTMVRLFGPGEDEEQKVLKKHLGPKDNPRYDLVPWEIIEPYATKDAQQTLRLTHYQLDLYGFGEAHKPWLRRENRVTTVLYNMEQRGLPYDPIKSGEQAQELTKRLAKLAKDLPFRPTETAAKDYYFGEGKTAKGADCLELPPYALTKPSTKHPHGQPSLTAEIVDRMVGEGKPYAEIWQAYTRGDNARGMWYQPYADRTGKDGRLRTSFRQVQVRSGRFSVERVNLQAMPHDYRLTVADLESAIAKVMVGLLTPRQIIELAVRLYCEGWELWELDLRQAELRVAAMWAKCDRMISAIKEDRDLHGETTSELFDKTEDDLDWGKYRQVGKRGNFTLCFGAGGPTFRSMVRKETGIALGEHEANKIVRDWNELYPEFGRAIERHMVRAERLHFVPLVNGRRRWFAKWEDCHKAFNQRVQASLAELGKDWMLLTDEYLIGKGLDERGVEEGVGRGGLLLTIHDSQVLLLPKGAEGEQMAQQCAEFGTQVWRELFPEIPGGVDLKRWGK